MMKILPLCVLLVANAFAASIFKLGSIPVVGSLLSTGAPPDLLSIVLTGGASNVTLSSSASVKAPNDGSSSVDAQVLSYALINESDNVAPDATKDLQNFTSWDDGMPDLGEQIFSVLEKTTGVLSPVLDDLEGILEFE